jgi:hypothetical protein
MLFANNARQQRSPTTLANNARQQLGNQPTLARHGFPPMSFPGSGKVEVREWYGRTLGHAWNQADQQT